MTQQNFMRNLRMTMPQYITNVTSFNDSVRILKNKGILVESDIREKNLDVDQEELKKGIAVEKEHTSDPVKAEEIALDHLAEDPEYYTKLDKAGLEESHEANEQWLDAFKSYIGDIDIKLSPTELLDKYDGMSPKDAARKYFKEFHSAPHSGEPGLTGHMEKIAKSLQRGLKEAKDEKGRWTNANGKSMYDQFKEIDNLNGQEVLIGIDYEIEKNHQLTKVEAAKIVIKNLKKNPIYYTSALMSGKEGYEPEYLGGKSANAEARQMQPVKDDNLVDKKMGMQPVKNIEKAKKDADAKKETNKIVKGVEELTFIAKTVRGVQKADPTGEKMKTIRESVDKALAKERLKEMIREEMKEIFDGRANMSYGMLGTKYDETGENK